MMKKSILLYAVYVALIFLLSLGLERKLIVWEWYFGMGWWRPLLSFAWLSSFAASIAFCAGTLQMFTFRNRAVRILVFVYTMICLAFPFFLILMEDRMPETRDVQIAFDGLKDFMIMGITIFQEYPKQILLVTAAALVVTSAMAVLGTRVSRLPKIPVRPWLALLLYVVGGAYYLFMPSMLDRMPIYGKTPLLLIRTMDQSGRYYGGPRTEPEPLTLHRNAFSSHVVFIMDESIAGYTLGLNGFPYDTTPFLSGLSRPYFNNYGIASSAGNYSLVSNVMVLGGLRADQIPDERQLALRQATIFAYAQSAGRKAYYVDAQNSKTMNMVSVRDMKYMEYIPIMNRLDTYEFPYLDRMGLKKIVDILDSSTEPTFIFLLKTGAHVPHGGKYPRDVDYKGLDAPTQEGRDYLFAVRWAVDDFFKELQAALAGKDVVVVYTSDHGHNISFDPASTDEMRRTLLYGSRFNPDSRESSVPMIIWPMSEKALEEYENLGGFRSENFGKSTHFQLFPTLLMLMGYDHEETKRRFGNSLFDEPPAKRIFATTYLIWPESEEQGGVFEFEDVPAVTK